MLTSFSLRAKSEAKTEAQLPMENCQSRIANASGRKALVFLVIAIGLSATAAAWGQTRPVVKTGIEVLRERGFDLLKGKRVGLITNPSGVDAQLRSTIDILAAAPDVKLAALFGPEHGVRGDAAAGVTVESAPDPKTGIMAYSLYGKTHKPTPEMLKDIDVLVYDIQDIGVRSYTYIWTLGLCMEAAAGQKITFVVLDRPDPLGGIRVEGTPVQKGFESPVSPFAIPYVYGLTPGELATLLNETGMLSEGAKCSLQVVPMAGWKRSMTFDQTGLQWVPTSPHVPAADGPLYYVATGVMGELGTMSEGVGYTIPFRLFGAPWIDAGKLADTLGAMQLPGVLFRPLTWRPFYGRDAEKELHGVQIYLTDPSRVDLMSMQFRLMEADHALNPGHDAFGADPSRIRMFDMVAGTDRIREAFTKRYRFEDIKDLLNEGVKEFKVKAKTYWLYE